MGIQETSNAITTATAKLKALLTAFNNEFGEDGSARGLKAIFDECSLSNPPILVELNALSIKAKVDYLFELRTIENRALTLEAVHEELVSINPGTGAFETLLAVKTWAVDNMGLVGVEVEKNCNALGAVRVMLSPFITTSMLKTHTDTITAFRDENTNQIPELGTD